MNKRLYQQWTPRPVFAERGLSGNSKDRRKQYRKYCLKYGWDNVKRINIPFTAYQVSGQAYETLQQGTRVVITKKEA
jgi:hypothetical protein